jgi:hypothetical protein
MIRATMLLSVAVMMTGCGGSNPLIGRWTPVKPTPSDCASVVSMEFTDTTETIQYSSIKLAYTVTYSQKGAQHIVTDKDGKVEGVFETDGAQIKTIGAPAPTGGQPIWCSFARAS